MTTERKTRAGIYVRQSHGKKKSIAEQVADCTRDLENDGADVVGVYEDTISASRFAKKARDDWPRLLAEVEAGALDVVGMWESSRGDRTLASWAAFLELCRDRGVLIRVTDDATTYDMRRPKDWRRLADDGVNNHYSSEETSRRIIRDKEHAAKAGHPLGGAPPFGYTRTYDPKTRELLEQARDPVTAPVVVEIVDRIADGETLADVARDLNDRGVPTSKGTGRWSASRIRGVVRHVAYIGKLRHNGDLHDAEWPPIVDPGKFYAAQRVLDIRKGQGWRSARAEHLLTGIPRCAECGGVYAGRMERERGQWYGCRNKGCGYVNGPELEELVLAYVLGRLARQDVYVTLKRQGEGADREAAAARAQAAELRARLDEWRDSAVRGETTPATMAKLERELTAQITAAELKAERAGIPPAVRDLIDAGGELPSRWAKMSMAAQRDVVGALVDVVAVRGKKGVKVPTAERVTITWKGTS